MEVKGILISIVAPFENHIANGGEKLLGNASSIKRRSDGKVYISGQMQRHVLFSAIDKLNLMDSEKGLTFVSNGDGVTNKIELDLRADMGGFMHTSKGDYSGRRTAPLSVTPAVAMKESNVNRDLLVRVKMDGTDSSNEQALATKEFSEKDVMLMNFHLDVGSLGISKKFRYEGGFNTSVQYVKHTIESERKRRVKLFIEASRLMNDYANQARNAVCGEPQKVIIVFDSILSRKASRYFEASELERKNIIEELKSRGSKFFIGDDTTENSVLKAYNEAIKYLEYCDLYDPSESSDEEVKTFKDVFGELKESKKTSKKSDAAQ